MILRKVRNSPGFALIADEVTDCSNKEQLCIVLRYVDPETNAIREDLILFLECECGLTGQALADKMMGFVRNNLGRSKIHDQAYDGTSNMSGKIRGAAARIQSQYPLAFYTHCASHCLNLAVVASFEGQNVCNMIGITKRLFLLFFLHILSARRNWKKLYRMHSLNQMY